MLANAWEACKPKYSKQTEQMRSNCYKTVA